MADPLHPRTPILVGCAQYTQRAMQLGKPEEAESPLAMLARVARDALADTGAAGATTSVDTIAVVRFTADSSEAGRLPIGQYTNAPRSLANAIGAPRGREIYTAAGGNTPQYLVNRTAEEIAQGRTEFALLAGCETLATLLGSLKAGRKLDWGDDPGGEPEKAGDFRSGVNAQERAYGLYFPVNVYPMLENAIRAKKGRTVEAHLKALGTLFERFNAVAAKNKLSWFPTKRSAEEIATPSEKNRFVGFPYPKFMNSVIEVDQAAAVVMTSVEKARALGIPEAKWVYLHGCADATEVWHVSERVDYHTSYAIRTMTRHALAMADLKVEDLALMDLYSCFPSAVEYALDALGLAEDDPRGFTVTGGLPYFGGAGNNYVMHSIAEMVTRLRAKPGAYGLVTANGWFATKHACGIYSTKPTRGAWAREAPATYQTEIDAMARPEVVWEANGPAAIETYTVVHDRATGPKTGIVIGRLGDGKRFVAHTPGDAATLNDLMSKEGVGRPGAVSFDGTKNVFVPA
jgi:acetyl-CoA C-acetyltransferase